MRKSVLFSLVLLIVAGLAVFFLSKSSATVYKAPADDQNQSVPDISTDTVWNAYTVSDTVFIYPSDWTFAEETDGVTSKVTGFKVTYPISPNASDSIEVGGSCPTAVPVAALSFCVNGTWLHSESQNQKVINIFDDMKKFGENQQKK